MAQFNVGDTAFIVDNRIFLREVVIKRATTGYKRFLCYNLQGHRSDYTNQTQQIVLE